MQQKFINLLESLKSNFSQKKLQEVINYFNDELSVDDISNMSVDLFGLAINGQHQAFYQALAMEFEEDLNSFPEMYFLLWEFIIGTLNDDSRSIFFEATLELAQQTDAADYVNGIMELEKDQPEMALFYFNRIEHYIVRYFLGICYLELENYENSIKQNLQFLKNFDQVVNTVNDFDLKENIGILVLRWNVYNDLAYASAILQEFEQALTFFNKSLEILDLEQAFQIDEKTLNSSQLDPFESFVRNYLIVLGQTGHFEKCMEVLEFMKQKCPKEAYYRETWDKLQALSSVPNIADTVFNRLIKPKKPFNLDGFESVKMLSKERLLEDLIIEQIKRGYHVFHRPLEVYQDDKIYGKQYRIPEINGILDLLLIDKTNDQLYVVELKREKAGIEVVDQVEKYRVALSKLLNRHIKGIICLHQSNPQLTELVKVKDHIELFTYGFEFVRSE